MALIKNILLKSLAILAASRAVSAHSWVEEVRKIDLSGAFEGGVGRSMHWMNRTADGFSDDKVQNKILDTKPNPAICKPIDGAYYAGANRLNASAGDYVALVYQENGHVTQPFLTPRPYRDGLVSIYGTMQHEDNDGINDVLNSWTADGKGGNGKGQLLATHYYDDGQCYQNAGQDFNIKIYAERQKKYGLSELYCQSDFQLPEDLPETGTYTVMWVWDWPLIVTDTTNSTEIYTSCAEITLEPRNSSSTVQAMKFSKDTPVNSAAISSQLFDMYEATGLGIGTSPPGAPTTTPAEDSTATADVSATTTAADSTSTSKKHHHGIKTVTVTAAAETTTQWKTVTAGAGNAAQPETSQTASSSTQATSSAADSSPAAPTSSVPVVSVSKFLKARATGHARREVLP
ncbi:hypothetical protein F4820DRAFT_287811 [Hypoxylon rubiginosum]|uniref:Uncharacterized protein n=1 Tax=Hypoxylon rubiginosum TaxID=110542 RepID=A0ACB9ZF43_9PEZI|nr:hypothetical protein F4820DRAFT_287811 [Hypoxylon rubiginosum]